MPGPFPTKRKFRLAFQIAVLLAFTLFKSPAVADISAPCYLTRVWQAENGLPQNKVTAVVQTRDGYLWLGTYSGLARFDGVRFTIFDNDNTPEMPSSRITCLCEAQDGTLWIGDESGNVTGYSEGKFHSQKSVASFATWKRGEIYDMATDDAGDVWLLNEAGQIARLRDGLVLQPESGPMSKVVSMARSADGTIWIARNGRVSSLKHGQLTVLRFTGDYPNLSVTGIGPSRDGGLWIASNRGFGKWKDGYWREQRNNLAGINVLLTRIIEIEDGVLAAGTPNDGLYLVFSNQTENALHFTHTTGFPSDWITSLLEDREKNLWIGTGGGLILLRQNHIQTVSPPDQWQGRAVLSVYYKTNGALWVGTEGAGLYRQNKGIWENFAYSNGLANPYVWSLTENANGQLLAGTWGGGLFVQNGNRFEQAPGTTNITLPMPALLHGRDDELWIGTADGPLHYENGKAHWLVHSQSLRDVRAVAEGNDGGVWFGTAGNGLGYLKDGQIHQFRRNDGLSSDFVDCLHFDENGALWIGTFGGGLTRLKAGKFSVIGHQQGLPNNVIGDIEDDGLGNFWMSSHGGIIRVNKTELNDCADGKIKSINCLAYGISDGLPTIECSEGLQPAGCKTPDGRLWFPTSKGLVVINPAALRINHLPPPMAFESLLVDGQVVTNLASPLKIPPGGSHFEFHYTGLSFVAPEKMQFKYRIEGLEKEWKDAGSKRVAEYSFLPPGNYSFHVIACNNDAVWNETGVSLPFTLLPYFWQTWWFRFFGALATVLAAGGIVWLDARRRMRLRLEKLERGQAIERERARIARDIHDDLGASLTRITMLSQSARDETQLPGPVAKNLERIFGTARELTRSMDEIVWAVNPRHDTLDSLANYLNRFAYDFLRQAQIRCRLDVPLQLPALLVTAETRHNLFLAFKESLHNVVKHADATEVRVELKLEPSKLTLVVADNGRGFSADGSVSVEPDRLSTGNGLVNMKRRLAEIGGLCEIQTKPSHGTTVKFSVPLCA